MESNLNEILPSARKALEWDCYISFSSFCTLKANEESEWVRKDRMQQLAEIVDELREMKRKYRYIKNSAYYLDHIVPYFRDGGVGGCKAGHNFIQITPDGYVQRCSEMPRMAHYTQYWPTQVGQTLCTKCWYGCRGETEAPPLAPTRLKDLLQA